MIVFEQSEWVSRRSVDGHAVGIGSLRVAKEGVCARIDRREGAHRRSAPDSTGVGEACVALRAFDIDVQLEMVVKEYGGQRETSRVACHIIGAEYTVLVADTERQAVRQKSNLAGYAEVVVGTKSGMEDLIVPVGIDIGVEQCFLTVGAISADEVVHLVTGDHVGRLRTRLQRVGRRERDLRTLGVDTFLSRDDDDTVGGTRAVDSG